MRGEDRGERCSRGGGFDCWTRPAEGPVTRLASDDASRPLPAGGGRRMALLLHCLCMPNIAPCRLTLRPQARGVPPWPLPPVPPQVSRSLPPARGRAREVLSCGLYC